MYHTSELVKWDSTCDLANKNNRSFFQIFNLCQINKFMQWEILWSIALKIQMHLFLVKKKRKKKETKLGGGGVGVVSSFCNA